MIGSLLKGIVKVVTLPVTIMESVGDVMTGGDGSERSKRQSDVFMGQDIIDGICKGLDGLDKL